MQPLIYSSFRNSNPVTVFSANIENCSVQEPGGIPSKHSRKGQSPTSSRKSTNPSSGTISPSITVRSYMTSTHGAVQS